MPPETGKRAGAALVIGIGNYLHGDQVPRLRHAPDDARAFAELLTTPGVCGFPEDQVTLLLDQEADRETILNYLSEWLPERSRGADITVIYFAGHGVVRKSEKYQEGYLLSHEANRSNLIAKGLSMTDLGRCVNELDAACVVIILDCCHSGMAVANEGITSRGAAPEFGIGPGVIEALSRKGRVLIASCDEGQDSIEDDRLGHGLFTYHLLRGMRGEADSDGDRKVGIGELFNFVSRHVSEDADRVYHTVQHPWASQTWTRENFISWVAPNNADPGVSGTARHERLWRSAGPAAAISKFEAALESGEEPELVSVLRFLRSRKEPLAVPFLFGCLGHASEGVGKRAKLLIQAYGWEMISRFVSEVGRQPRDERFGARVGMLLKGLRAYRARPILVEALEGLVVELSGALRTEAERLLQEKRLKLQFGEMKSLFEELRTGYRLEKPLGPGRYTDAYLATYEETGSPVVVRVLRPHLARDPAIVKPFLEVSRRSYDYDHHGLVRTLAVVRLPERKIYYVVRKYVEGLTLQTVLAGGKRFEPLQVLEVLRQALDALAPVHERGAFHGGIKPSNVFLAKEEPVRIILGDASPAMLPDMNSEWGRYDYHYSAPELSADGRGMGPRSDLYSLGCLAYELACGSPPFRSDDPFELMSKHRHEAVAAPSRAGSVLGVVGDAFLAQLLAKAPRNRYGSLDEAQFALGRVREALRSSRNESASSRPVTLIDGASLLGYQPAESIMDLSAAPPAPRRQRDPGQEVPGGPLTLPPGESADAFGPSRPAGATRCPRCKATVRAIDALCPNCGALLDPFGTIGLSGPVAPAEGRPSGPPAPPPPGPHPTIKQAGPDRPREPETPAPSDHHSTDSESIRVRFECPNPECGHSFEGLVGESARCPRCGTDLNGDTGLAEPTEPINPSTAPRAGGPALAEELSRGARLGDRYEIVRRLGTGGMGTVYLGRDVALDRLVALKLPIVAQWRAPEFIARFRREALAIAKLDHPNICSILDVGQVEDQPYLTMKYIEGESLHARLKASDRPLSVERVVRLVRSIATTMQFAHERGVIHRDLKPSNIMIEGRGAPIVMDFGLALRIDTPDSHLTQEGQLMGTPAFMPPEQFLGELRAIGPHSDIYSLGVILYQLLTGELPYPGPPLSVFQRLIAADDPPRPSAVRSEIEPALDAICMTAMAKRAEDRFATMGDFAEALANYLSGQIVATSRPASAGLSEGGPPSLARPWRGAAPRGGRGLWARLKRFFGRP